ncbi:MAG: sugar phosphate isomerase/epimerase [Arcicella sp.]|nr:sugar phosphate isomerase/epimerase [Arcicella sp.]
MTHLISRRSFLQTSALAGTALLTSNSLLASGKKAKNIGLQLYSVRDEMKKDPIATMKAVAEMGYKNVEHANYVDGKFYGFEPKEFRKIIDDLGLVMRSGHTVMGGQHWDASKNDFTDVWKKTVEDAAVLGQKYVVSPWLDVSLRKSFDDCKRFMEVFNKSGELCKKSGMKFGYHNHDFEFSLRLTSVKVFDIIMQNTDPNLVAQQLDIGNMYNGGGRPLELLKQYPNRFELMHVKDEIKGEKEHYESTILGTGIVGVADVLKLAAKYGGTTEYIIEQESYQGKMPMDSVKEDLAWINKAKF